MADLAIHTARTIARPHDFPGYSPVFEEMLAHFLRLPADTLVREVWHSHAKKHLNRFFHRQDFADRAREELGYHVPSIYSEHLRSSEYRIKWLVLEDEPSALDAFGRIFDHFNLYTTLNRYPLAYALARLKVMLAEYKLHLANLNQHIPAVVASLPALEEATEVAREAVPTDCFVDLAFDVDVGEGKEIESLEGAIPFVLRLVDFCERYEIPHTAYFTGGRGFHVVIPSTAFGQTPASDNHLINRRMAALIEEETGELHIDPAIYSNRRQFRLPNSRHQKTGLFKIALTRVDLARGEAHVIEKAERRVPDPGTTEDQSEYLTGLYALAADEIRSRPRFEVGPKRALELPAARQSAPRDTKTPVGTAITAAPAAIDDLVHPPCVRQALQTGVVDSAVSNRNQVTLLLANYFKAIGRRQDETAELLVRHANQVLARFSSSGPVEIASSTRTATATVFRNERYVFNCHSSRRLGFACNDTCEIFPKNRETASSRRLHRVTADTAPATLALPSNAECIEFADVDGLRAHLADRVRDYIGDVKTGVITGERKPPLLVKAPAGSGKTVTVFNKTDSMGLRTLWVATRLDLYDNIPDAVKPRWRRIEGRHPKVTLPSGEILPANCTQHVLAHRLREKRLNVNRHLCRRCDDRTSCGYFAQFRDKQSSFFVQQPMYLHKVKDYAPEFDVAVFDEDILSEFVESVRIQPHDAQRVHKLVGGMEEDLRAVESGAEADELIPLVCLLTALEYMLAEERVSRPITGEVLHRRMEEAYQAVVKRGLGAGAPRTLGDAVAAIPVSLDTFVDDIYERDEEAGDDDIPLQFLNALLPVLRFELFERSATSNLSRLRFASYRVPARPDDPNGRRRFRNVLEVTFKAPAPPLPTPTVILDATGKPEIYERLFDARPIVYAPTMRLENHVRQIYSSSGSYGSLRNAVHRAHLLEVLQIVVAEEPRSLVICKKALKDKIKPLLPPEATVSHFYGNRGSNAFQEFRRVVILGMPGMAPEAVLRYAGAFYYADDLSTDTEERVREYFRHGPRSHDTPRGVGVKVLVYKEPLIQAINETAREDEVLQSIHRIRPGLDASKDVVLITNLVIPELPVSDLVTVNDIRGRKTQDRVDAKREVLSRLTKLQLERLGFVSPARTLFPIVSGRSPPDDATRAYLEACGVWEDAPDDVKMSRTRFFAYKREVRDAVSVKRFDVRLISAQGSSPLELWGRDASCVDAARSFFENHPSCLGVRLRLEGD